jgi:hypothetical protein
MNTLNLSVAVGGALALALVVRAGVPLHLAKGRTPR